MLPISLTISGINSFKTEQTIDFSALTSGFFGIFGATGSGKSTILDALTLALYGRTPRAKTGNDFITLGKTSAFVKFIFKLGKREYMIERTFKRKKEGKQTESTACLYQKQGDSFNVLVEGVYDCDARVKKILGLGFEEFSKVIALPQGQFANFLNSTSAERTNLISNLFNLNGFGQGLTDVVKLKEKEAGISLATTKGELEGLSNVSQDGFDKICQNLEEKQAELKDAEGKVNKISGLVTELEVILVKVDELNKAKEKLGELEAQREAVKAKEERVEKITNALPLLEILNELEKAQKTENGLNQELEVLKADFKASCEEYDNLSGEVEELNKNFDNDYENLLKTLSQIKDLEKAEPGIEALKTKKENVESEISSYKALAEQTNVEKEEMLDELAQLESELNKSKDYLEEVKVDENIAAQVKKGAELFSQVEIIETLANDLTSINFKILKKQQELTSVQEQLDSLTSDNGEVVNARLEEINEFNNEISKELTKLMDLKSERKSIIDSLEKRFGGQSLYHIKNAIEKSEATEKNIRSKIAEVEREIGDIALQIKLKEAQIRELEAKIAVNQQNLMDMVKQIEDFAQKLAEIAQNAPLKDKIGEIEFKIEELSQTKANKNKELQNCYVTRANLEAHVKQKLVELNDKTALKNSLNESLNQKLQNLNLTKDEVLDLASNQGFLVPLKASIDEFKTNFALYSNLKNKLEDELKGIDAEPEELEGLRLEKTQNEAKLREIQLENGVILAKKQKMEADLIKKEALTERLNGEQKRLDLINELLKSLRGRALAEFVAKIYLETITARANNIASMLLEGKFTLCFKDGEFVVLDNLNGQEERSVGTLSGGETFLISLALSLAISEAISNEANHNLDFFFLDEGFGTLDNELCDTVISALYKLQNQNLKIGVISHVDLLKERINNKLIVTKTENEGSKIDLEISL